MLHRREFLKQIGFGTMGLASLPYLTGCNPSPTETATNFYSPESQGVSSQGLIDFFDAVQKSDLEFHSIMINRNGKTILEGWWQPFEKEYVHNMYSLSKSFTSTAIGMLHDEGKISIDDKVVSFFPDKLPDTVSDNLAAMRVYDLLTMNTGHNIDTLNLIRKSGEDDWVKTFLQFDVAKQPGTYFFYNTGATYMLSAILQKLTGQNLMTYLQPRLFEPLGIIGADWEEDPLGINLGGTGMRIRTQDILNFGQLYLQEGEWKGKQLLSKEWIAEATKKQVDSQDNDTDWGQGYGYQFWRCKPGCYRGDGAYGQYCIVIPEKNAVIAITSETKDMGASMQLVWDHILPAMQDKESLPDNAAVNETLLQTTSQLSLPVVDTSVSDNLQSQINGYKYKFGENTFSAQTVSFQFSDDICTIGFVENGKTINIKSGLKHWETDSNKKEANTLFAITGRTPMSTKISSYYYWKNKNTLVMKAKYVENAHHDIFTFTFSENGLVLTFDNSLSFQKRNVEGRPSIEATLI